MSESHIYRTFCHGEHVGFANHCPKCRTVTTLENVRPKLTDRAHRCGGCGTSFNLFEEALQLLWAAKKRTRENRSDLSPKEAAWIYEQWPIDGTTIRFI